jgi:hypothetical protein
MTNRSTGFYAFTRRALTSAGAVALSGSLWEAGDGGQTLGFVAGGGPIRLACERASAGARSLRLAQRIVFSFVQALDFAAVKTLIPHLQPSAEGSGYA